MLPPLRALRAAASRLRPRQGWWLGAPYRATITPFACGGYFLAIAYTQGVDRVDLADRSGDMQDYDHPDERDFAAADSVLAARNLALVLPWELDHNGNLTAPVTSLARKDNR